MLASLLFVVWMYGGMLLIGLVFLPTLLFPGRAPAVAAIVWAHQMRLGLRLFLGIRLELRGREHFPESPVLIAGKHHAMLDTLMPFLLRGTRPVVVLKRELLKLPVFGWYAARLGCIAIDREASLSALKQMSADAEAARAKGRDVFIYPEGTRQDPGAAPDYKPGVAALYKAFDCPCVPVATNAGLCWPAHGLRRRKGVIVYEALPPIPPGLPRREFMARLQGELEAASERLLDEGLAAQGRTREDMAAPLTPPPNPA